MDQLSHHFLHCLQTLQFFEIFAEFAEFAGTHLTTSLTTLYCFHDFAATIRELKGWRFTIDSRTQSQQMQRYLHKTDLMITPEVVEDLVRSKYYEKAHAVFSKASKEPVNSKEFIIARDLLLVRFALALSHWHTSRAPQQRYR